MSSRNLNLSPTSASERESSAFVIPATEPETDAALLAELEYLKKEHHLLCEEWQAKDLKIEKLTANAVKTQQMVEVEEEQMTNKLLKKIEDMSKNKANIRQRLQEEMHEKEAITGQVAMVHANLVEIENQIETEQNCILHKLQRELIDVSTQKAQTQRNLYVERGEYLKFMRQTLDKIIEANPDLDLASPVMSPSNLVMASNPNFPNAPLPPSAAVSSAQPAVTSSTTLMSSIRRAPIESVSALEHELNALLHNHYETEALLLEDEMMCEMLAQMLARVHHEVNDDRDRLMSIESDLQRAQADVAIAERRIEYGAQQDPNSAMSEDGEVSSYLRMGDQTPLGVVAETRKLSASATPHMTGSETPSGAGAMDGHPRLPTLQVLGTEQMSGSPVNSGLGATSVTRRNDRGGSNGNAPANRLRDVTPPHQQGGSSSMRHSFVDPSPASSTSSTAAALQQHTYQVLSTALSSTPQTPHRTMDGSSALN